MKQSLNRQLQDTTVRRREEAVKAVRLNEGRMARLGSPYVLLALWCCLAVLGTRRSCREYRNTYYQSVWGKTDQGRPKHSSQPLTLPSATCVCFSTPNTQTKVDILSSHNSNNIDITTSSLPFSHCTLYIVCGYERKFISQLYRVTVANERISAG